MPKFYLDFIGSVAELQDLSYFNLLRAVFCKNEHLLESASGASIMTNVTLASVRRAYLLFYCHLE